jgi:hypothetical protein
MSGRWQSEAILAQADEGIRPIHFTSNKPMPFDGSSKYDERSLSMAGLRVPAVYKVTAFQVYGEPFTFTCPEEMRWEELLPTISKEAKAYAQTTSLIHTSSDMNRLLLYETIDDIGVTSQTPRSKS